MWLVSELDNRLVLHLTCFAANNSMVRTGMISTIDRDNSELSSLCNAWILYATGFDSHDLYNRDSDNIQQYPGMLTHPIRTKALLYRTVSAFMPCVVCSSSENVSLFQKLVLCFYIDDLQRVGEYIRAFCQAAHFPGHPISSGTIPPDCYRPSSLLFIGIENCLVRCCYVDELKRLVVTTIERQGELMYIGGGRGPMCKKLLCSADSIFSGVSGVVDRDAFREDTRKT